MKGHKVLPDPGFDKEVEASLHEESSMVHEDLWFDEVKKVDTPIPHVGFVILEEFHKVEYKVYLLSLLPKTIPQLQQVSCTRFFILQSLKTQG